MIMVSVFHHWGPFCLTTEEPVFLTAGALDVLAALVFGSEHSAEGALSDVHPCLSDFFSHLQNSVFFTIVLMRALKARSTEVLLADNAIDRAHVLRNFKARHTVRLGTLDDSFDIVHPHVIEPVPIT